MNDAIIPILSDCVRAMKVQGMRVRMQSTLFHFPTSLKQSPPMTGAA